ncbi:MAG: 16S rRNA (guanine(527)-N(7))-methyltransferase RsmG [Syntrophobacteraceae bacterium]
MAKILRAAGISLSPVQVGQLWKYHQLLRQYNQELNLTRIHNFENMVRKLYIDSILPSQFIELPSPLMDLGTGPGMPGIPLKIVHPCLEVILVESRRNRIEFLQTALQELGLKKIDIIGRGVNSSSEIPVNGVITRALESIPQTLERIAGSLAKGGHVIFMKGPHCEEEIEQALDRYSGRFRLVKDHSYRIPNSPDDRRLVVFERTDSPAWARKAELEEEDLVRTIESEHNETFRSLKKLLSPRGIRKQLQALVFGQKQVSEILAGFPEKCIAWISRGERMPPPEDSPHGLMWYQLAPPLYETIDLFGTDFPVLLVRIEQIPKWEPHEGLPQGCTLLIPFQDPENVGAVIRSAVAFGAASIILLSEAANPYHPKAIRASGGMVFRAKLHEGPSINDLPADLPIVPLSKEGESIADFEFPPAFGLLPGVEGPGLPERYRKGGISIPISPGVESLNAVVATAIALFAWAGSRKAD